LLYEWGKGAAGHVDERRIVSVALREAFVPYFQFGCESGGKERERRGFDPRTTPHRDPRVNRRPALPCGLCVCPARSRVRRRWVDERGGDVLVLGPRRGDVVNECVRHVRDLVSSRFG